MRPSEQAPLVAEDVEVGDFSDDVEETTGPTQSARSRTMCRTTLAVLMLGGLAAMVVVGPVNNPLHASPEFQQKWGLGDFWESAKNKVSEGYNSAKDAVSEHVDVSAITDTVTEHATNAYNWGKEKAGEYWKHAEEYMDTHISPETREWMKEKIAALKALPALAKEKAEEVFCQAKANLGNIKERLKEKILADFSDKTKACGQDFRSQACRDEMVADACANIPTIEVDGLGSVTAAKDLCEVTMQEAVKHMQDHLAAKVDIIKAQQATAQDPEQSKTLLRTSVDLEMGEVDKEVNDLCSTR